MAKLFLTGRKYEYRQPDGKIIASKARFVRDVTLERLHGGLSERLAGKYDVLIASRRRRAEHGQFTSDCVKVRKDALMSIVVDTHPKGGGTEFVTHYEYGSVIALPLMLLVIPAIRLSRSPARHELEAEVIDALRDCWPEVTVQD